MVIQATFLTRCEPPRSGLATHVHDPARATMPTSLTLNSFLSLPSSRQRWTLPRRFSAYTRVPFEIKVTEASCTCHSSRASKKAHCLVYKTRVTPCQRVKQIHVLFQGGGAMPPVLFTFSSPCNCNGSSQISFDQFGSQNPQKVWRWRQTQSLPHFVSRKSK